jgi:thiamine kinase-like enzyme
MKSYPIVENKSISLSNVPDEIYSIIQSIRPDWNSSNTRLVKFTEGITNVLFGLFDNRTADDQSQALVIKLFGANTELFLNREIELSAMEKLSKEGVLSQRVLIKFNNGIIYEYAVGIPCSREDVRKQNIAQAIAIKLAQFHSVPTEQVEKSFILVLLRKFLQLLNENEEQKKGLKFYLKEFNK